MIETEFVTVPIQHWENSYALMGICIGVCLGSLLTMLAVGLCREIKK